MTSSAGQGSSGVLPPRGNCLGGDRPDTPGRHSFQRTWSLPLLARTKNIATGQKGAWGNMLQRTVPQSCWATGAKSRPRSSRRVSEPPPPHRSFCGIEQSPSSPPPREPRSRSVTYRCISIRPSHARPPLRPPVRVHSSRRRAPASHVFTSQTQQSPLTTDGSRSIHSRQTSVSAAWVGGAGEGPLGPKMSYSFYLLGYF